MRSLLQDVRFAVRLLGKNPGFTAAAVLSLSLGIAANTTIFSVVNAILLRPLPIEEPDRVITMAPTYPNDERFTSTSYLDFRDYERRQEAFSGVAIYRYMPFSLTGADKAEIVLGELVSGSYFETSGAPLVKGRGFLPEEDKTRDTHAVCVLGYDAWVTRYDQRSDILEQEILINNYPFRVVGVTAKGFRGMSVALPSQVWVPVMMHDTVDSFDNQLESRNSHNFTMIGRLKPEISLAQAQDLMSAQAARLSEEYPDSHENKGIQLIPSDHNRVPLFFVDRSAVNLFMSVLMAVVGLVLLIACFNVANMLLARAAGRQREIAVRLALGSGRWRVFRQLLVESLLLAGIATALGTGAAYFATRGLMAIDIPSPVPLMLEMGIDLRVLFFSAVLAVVTALVFGLAPAWQAIRPQLFAALKGDRGSVGHGARGSWAQRGLVSAQVGLSLVLLATAGLCVQSLQNAVRLDVGFEPDNLLLMLVNPSLARYDNDGSREYFDRLLRSVKAVPGVEAASIGTSIPLGLDSSSSWVDPDGYEPAPDERMSVYHHAAAPDYFQAMGIPVVEGRVFDERETADSEQVIIVNQTFAERYWPDKSALGRSVFTQGSKRRVVGVVGAGKYRDLGEAPEPYYYLPLEQNFQSFAYLHVRTAGDPGTVLASVLQQAAAVDANVPLANIQTGDEHLGLARLPSRMLGWIAGVFGMVALILASIGLYGVMAYSVSQRVREFGVRSALGATPSDILRLVFSQGMLITLFGAAIGALAAVAAGRLVSGVLLGIDGLDWGTFGSVAGVLLAVSAVAALFPARRATRVDPMNALRYE